MTIAFGSDIVHIPKFEKAFRENKDYFREKVFSSEELNAASLKRERRASPSEAGRDANTERLAGVFAAKEAVVKGLGLEAGQWLEIQIGHEENGKPFVVTYPGSENKQHQHQLSIAHDGEYVIANVIFYQ